MLRLSTHYLSLEVSEKNRVEVRVLLARAFSDLRSPSPLSTPFPVGIDDLFSNGLDVVKILLPLFIQNLNGEGVIDGEC